MSTVTDRQPPPQVEDIEKSLDGFFSRVARKWKTILLWTIIVGFAWFVMLPSVSVWAPFIPTILGIVFQLLFALLFIAVQFGMMFYLMGRPRIYWVYPGETGVGFKDYRGNPEVLEVASRIVTLLKGVKEFKSMGGQVTRGVLLVGPPGTGKSYLGQCISTEAGVPFGYLSAPSIQGMFMGMDTLRVLTLYNKARGLAKKYGGCILFIDEIDAIGRSRSGMGGGAGGMMGGMFGGGTGGLNQLLNEMDPLPRDGGLIAKLKRRIGLKVPKPEIPLVLTMGATNIAQTLDAALLRPGRFDRKIFVDYPDYDGRKEIIKYYLDKVAHEALDLDLLASETIDQSPAALKFIVNEAVINAHFNGRTKITYEDFALALDNHEVGVRRPIRNMLQEEKRAIAYHEAGHATAMLKLLRRSRVTRVTIVRHEGGALGFAMPKKSQETYLRTRDDILADIQVNLAARAAEELFLGTQYNGVVSDFQSATALAADFIGVRGMNGTISSYLAYGGAPDGPLKKDVEKLLREQFLKVKHLLDLNHELVVAIAEALLVRLDLTSDDLLRIEEEVERRKRQIEDRSRLPERTASMNVLDLLPADGASVTAAYRDENPPQ